MLYVIKHDETIEFHHNPFSDRYLHPTIQREELRSLIAPGISVDSTSRDHLGNPSSSRF
jgi:hypothetical protein